MERFTGDAFVRSRDLGRGGKDTVKTERKETIMKLRYKVTAPFTIYGNNGVELAEMYAFDEVYEVDGVVHKINTYYEDDRGSRYTYEELCDMFGKFDVDGCLDMIHDSVWEFV